MGRRPKIDAPSAPGGHRPCLFGFEGIPCIGANYLFSVSTQPCQERPAERSISEASGTLSTHHPREKKEKRPSLTIGRWGARLSPEKRRNPARIGPDGKP